MRKPTRKVRPAVFHTMNIFTALLILFSFGLPSSFAQTSPPAIEQQGSEGPKVFLDWPGGDIAFTRSEILFVSFVDSLTEAEVHVQVTSGTAEGKDVFTLNFRGRGGFAGDDNTLTHTAASADTPEKVKADLMRMLKIGLTRYAAKTPVADRLSVNFQDAVKPTAVEDKWNFWVFNISANAFLNGEAQFKHNMFNTNISANRITPKSKIRMAVTGSFTNQSFQFGDELLKSSRESYGFQGLFVKSINEHWSVGAFLTLSSSTYSNLKLLVSPAPAVEFNFFPYTESTKKQLRILYRIGYTSVNYREETVYLKTSEHLLRESLSVTLEVKRPWGTIGASLEGSHYFHDFKKNRLVLGGDIALRIWKGLRLTLDGGGSMIHDQLSLPRGDATLEEILLRQRQLETGYNYFFAVGLSFTFGSTASHIVNPRFGNSGGAISISF